jgi:hypothetical protein
MQAPLATSFSEVLCGPEESPPEQVLGAPSKLLHPAIFQLVVVILGHVLEKKVILPLRIRLTHFIVNLTIFFSGNKIGHKLKQRAISCAICMQIAGRCNFVCNFVSGKNHFLYFCLRPDSEAVAEGLGRPI